MKILFHSDDEFSKDAEDLVRHRCEFAFDRFRSVIREIRVTARDENGPRGGNDIHCIILVSLAKLADVIVHEQAISFEIAVNTAIDRAAFQVSRRIHRLGDTIRRQSMPQAF